MPGLPDRVLVANRGEIAVRVIRACRDLGIEAVAVYSDADADALHVALADEAVEIGTAPAQAATCAPRPSSRRRCRPAAARCTPATGSSSEDAALCRRRAREAGIAFVGPPADVMAAVGDKVAARAAAERRASRSCPAPGAVEDADAALAAAEEIGFPVLLKASAGGGGRGIRACRRPRRADGRVLARVRARPRPRSATAGCSWRSASSARATSRCRCSPTRTAT